MAAEVGATERRTRAVGSVSVPDARNVRRASVRRTALTSGRCEGDGSEDAVDDATGDPANSDMDTAAVASEDGSALPERASELEPALGLESEPRAGIGPPEPAAATCVGASDLAGAAGTLDLASADWFAAALGSDVERRTSAAPRDPLAETLPGVAGPPIDPPDAVPLDASETPDAGDRSDADPPDPVDPGAWEAFAAGADEAFDAAEPPTAGAVVGDCGRSAELAAALRTPASPVDPLTPPPNSFVRAGLVCCN